MIATGSEHDPGILRIDYPGFSGEESLEPIEWDQWFDAFENNGLAFIYQEETEDGGTSRFSKRVAREASDERPSRKRVARRRERASR